jgi:hypothetical protein
VIVQRKQKAEEDQRISRHAANFAAICTRLIVSVPLFRTQTKINVLSLERWRLRCPVKHSRISRDAP